jgi:hypothetical protein
MTLQEKLDAFKTDFKAGKPPYNVPPEIHPIMERNTRELIASSLAQRALKAGDKAPDFTLPDANGRAVSSPALVADGPLIVLSYRGVWWHERLRRGQPGLHAAAGAVGHDSFVADGQVGGHGLSGASLARGLTSRAKVYPAIQSRRSGTNGSNSMSRLPSREIISHHSRILRHRRQSGQ